MVQVNPAESNPQPSPASESVSLEAAPRRELLEEVLAKTDRIARVLEPSADVEAELESLRRITRRYRGEPYLSEPILAEWVAAMLQDDLAAWAGPHLLVAEAAGQIAHTLGTDPFTRQRLDCLWQRLVDETSGEDEA